MPAGGGGVRTILRYGDQRLRRRCRAVRLGEEDVSGLADNLGQQLGRQNGVGLSAPQLGDLRRVIVVKGPKLKLPPRPLVLVNPVITSCSAQRIAFEEGCLSFPGLFLTLRRPAAVTIRYYDIDGAEHTLKSRGVLARIIQHEIDHLDGVLFIDHLSRVRRLLLSWRLRRIKTTGRREAVA